MDIISLLLADMPAGFWQSIIGWFSNFIVSYGWTIIVFTICLKLVLSPLDFYQKWSMRKTQKQQALIQPQLDEIQKKYGNNKDLLNQKTMELYQKNKISPMKGCLGMLINMALTMTIFFTLFGAMNDISQYKVAREYQTLQTEYVKFVNNETTVNFEGEEKTYNQCYDYGYNYFEQQPEKPKKADGTEYTNAEEYANEFAIRIAQAKVSDKFGEIKESWLWIKNIFMPDNYAASFPNYQGFIRATNSRMYNIKTEAGTEQKYYYKSAITNEVFLVTDDAETNKTNLKNAQIQGEKDFNLITQQIQMEYGSWNGYFVLIILAGATTLLSSLFGSAGMKAKNKDGEYEPIKTKPNIILSIVLPLMMMWFTWSYSAAFAVYIITNSIMSILLGYVLNVIISKLDKDTERKLVKVTKNSNSHSTKTVNNAEFGDYRIQKKGKIVYEDDKKSAKKSKKKNADKTEKVEATVSLEFEEDKKEDTTNDITLKKQTKSKTKKVVNEEKQVDNNTVITNEVATTNDEVKQTNDSNKGEGDK